MNQSKVIRLLLSESIEDPIAVAKSAGYTIGPVWHGTQSERPIRVFRGAEGAGWFASNEEAAQMFGEVQGPFLLKIRNPLPKDRAEEYKNAGSTLPYNEMLKAGPAWLRENGYDGIIGEWDEAGGDGLSYMVVSPSQVKLVESEIPLDQRFDDSNPDVRY